MSVVYVLQAGHWKSSYTSIFAGAFGSPNAFPSTFGRSTGVIVFMSPAGSSEGVIKSAATATAAITIPNTIYMRCFRCCWRRFSRVAWRFVEPPFWVPLVGLFMKLLFLLSWFGEFCHAEGSLSRG